MSVVQDDWNEVQVQIELGNSTTIWTKRLLRKNEYRLLSKNITHHFPEFSKFEIVPRYEKFLVMFQYVLVNETAE